GFSASRPRSNGVLSGCGHTPPFRRSRYRTASMSLIASSGKPGVVFGNHDHVREFACLDRSPILLREDQTSAIPGPHLHSGGTCAKQVYDRQTKYHLRTLMHRRHSTARKLQNMSEATLFSGHLSNATAWLEGYYQIDVDQNPADAGECGRSVGAVAACESAAGRRRGPSDRTRTQPVRAVL